MEPHRLTGSRLAARSLVTCGASRPMGNSSRITTHSSLPGTQRPGLGRPEDPDPNELQPHRTADRTLPDVHEQDLARGEDEFPGDLAATGQDEHTCFRDDHDRYQPGDEPPDRCGPPQGHCRHSTQTRPRHCLSGPRPECLHGQARTRIHNRFPFAGTRPKNFTNEIRSRACYSAFPSPRKAHRLGLVSLPLTPTPGFAVENSDQIPRYLRTLTMITSNASPLRSQSRMMFLCDQIQFTTFRPKFQA